MGDGEEEEEEEEEGEEEWRGRSDEWRERLEGR